MNFFQQWRPAIAGMFFLGFGAGLIGTYGFFVEPLSREFGVGVAVLNLAPVALLVVPGIISPFIGRLVDRVPIRRLILAGVTVAMGSLLLVSRAPSLALAGAAFLLFVFGLVMYGPVVVNGLLVKLYTGREARALAIAAIGISLAAALLPPITGALLGVMSWRAALAVLAGGLFLLLWVVAFVGIPAGSEGTADGGHERAATGIYRDRNFWLIGWCMAFGLNVSVILAVCYPPHFGAEGYTPIQAGWFLSLAGISGLFGKTLIAWLGDRIRHRAKWLVVVVIMLQVAGMGLLLRALDMPSVIPAMILLGFSFGAFLPLHSFLNSRYFDASVIGQVTGAQMPLFLPLGLVGAPLAGYVFDTSGSYQLVFLGLAALLCIAALLAVFLPLARAD
jgi:cyanate permease